MERTEARSGKVAGLHDRSGPGAPYRGLASRNASLAGLTDFSEPCLPGVPRRHVQLPSRDGGDDADLVAALELGGEALEEAHILLADVDVHEAPNAFGVEQPLLDPRVFAIDVVDHLADGTAGGGDFVLAAGQRPEGGRNTNDGFHGVSCFHDNASQTSAA